MNNINSRINLDIKQQVSSFINRNENSSSRNLYNDSSTIITRHSSIYNIHSPIYTPNYNNNYITTVNQFQRQLQRKSIHHVLHNHQTNKTNNSQQQLSIYAQAISQLNNLNPSQKSKFIQIVKQNHQRKAQYVFKIEQNLQLKAYKQDIQRKCFQHKVKAQISKYPVLNKTSIVRQKTQASQVNTSRTNAKFFNIASIKSIYAQAGLI